MDEKIIRAVNCRKVGTGVRVYFENGNYQDFDLCYFDCTEDNFSSDENKNNLWRLIICGCGEVIEHRASNFEEHTYEGEMLNLKKCRQIDIDMASKVKQNACEGCQETLLVGAD